MWITYVKLLLPRTKPVLFLPSFFSMNKRKKAVKSQEDTNQFWKKVLGILQTELNPSIFNTWVTGVTPENLTDTSIELVVPMDYSAKQLQKYTSLIQDSIERVGGGPYKIQFVVKKTTEKIEVDDLGPLFEPKKETKISKAVITKAGLNPKFTFENFIMGNSNQLAYAIAQSVAENPGKSYNPFFLYSGVGMGKTHLMQAIGNRILQNDPKTTAVYTTGESFMNELIESIQSGKGRGRYTSNEFRNKFRKTDVLLIDDIQEIVGKEATQAEFFHTFNSLYMAGKQIVLTSDRPPKDFTNLEKRITSRFGSGIIADIQHPETDLRVAILRTKRDQNDDDISNEVVDYIAEKVTSNIRELEGAYLQVLTTAKAKGKNPTPELAEGVLGKTVTLKRKKSLTLSQILSTVCKYYSLKTTDLKGKRRTKNIVIPRQVAMYLMRELTEEPLMNIGKFLGGRDHTTIMHGIDKVRTEIKDMGRIRQDVNNVKEML